MSHPPHVVRGVTHPKLKEIPRLEVCMWIFTEDGFFSTVVDRRDQSARLVRARDRDSLYWFCKSVGLDPKTAIGETPGRNYPYRAYVPEILWTGYLAVKGSDMSYEDFGVHCRKVTKSTNRFGEVKRFQVKQLRALSKIWEIMASSWEPRT